MITSRSFFPSKVNSKLKLVDEPVARSSSWDIHRARNQAQSGRRGLNRFLILDCEFWHIGDEGVARLSKRSFSISRTQRADRVLSPTPGPATNNTRASHCDHLMLKEHESGILDVALR
jgi:hypothetical protein